MYDFIYMPQMLLELASYGCSRAGKYILDCFYFELLIIKHLDGRSMIIMQDVIQDLFWCQNNIACDMIFFMYVGLSFFRMVWETLT